MLLKIINSIRAEPLQHRLFKGLLEEFEGKYSDLILCTEIRWLSKGEVLARFLSLIEEINDFLKSKNADFNELIDSCLLLDLAFLTDITDKARSLNLELQGKDKSVAQMRGSVKSSKAKLVLWMSHIKMKSLVHFPKYEENGR
jgi:hypothetical protein